MSKASGTTESDDCYRRLGEVREGVKCRMQNSSRVAFGTLLRGVRDPVVGTTG